MSPPLDEGREADLLKPPVFFRLAVHMRGVSMVCREQGGFRGINGAGWVG